MISKVDEAIGNSAATAILLGTVRRLQTRILTQDASYERIVHRTTEKGRCPAILLAPCRTTGRVEEAMKVSYRSRYAASKFDSGKKIIRRRYDQYFRY
jgi:hypothetical protein